MKEKLIEFAIIHPGRILWGTLLLTLGPALMIPRIEIEVVNRTECKKAVPGNSGHQRCHQPGFDALEIAGGGNYFNGQQQHTMFGQFEDNSNIYVRAKYIF